MARYYEITLTPTNLSLSLSGAAGQQGRVWTSYPNGQNDPGALNVQLDLLSGVYANPLGNSTVSIDGVSLDDLLQAKQFAGMDITVKGGMQGGLPLAKPSQNGVLIRGSIYQSFGNWVGTDQNLNFVIVPSLYTYAAPGNIVVNWQAGQPLADALAVTLNTAYPGYPRVMNIGQYTLARTEVARYQTLSQLARWLKSVTKSATSSGVDIALNNGQILVTDGSAPGASVQLDFSDLVGQPRWVEATQMQFSTVMRADIQVGNSVLMPKGIAYGPGTVTTGADTNPYNQLKQKTSFSGKFLIQAVRHVGNFREPDGTQWITTFQARPQSV